MKQTAPHTAPPNMKVQVFSHMRKLKCVYQSRAYKRVQSRNSYTIRFADGNQDGYGHIEFFAQYKPMCLCGEVCDCPVFNFAVVSILSTRTDVKLINDDITHASVPNIVIVVPPKTTQIRIVKIDKIREKCTYMQFCDSPDQAFIARFPNLVETY